MGEAKTDDLRVHFDKRVRLKFIGSQVTSDAGLLAYRELDEELGLRPRPGKAILNLELFVCLALCFSNKSAIAANYRVKTCGSLLPAESVFRRHRSILLRTKPCLSRKP